MAAPSFKDPAKQLQEDVEVMVSLTSGKKMPVIGSVEAKPMEMTPEMITRQNAVIKRLEGDFVKAKDKVELQRIVNVIRSHLKDFPGTTSSKIAEFEQTLKTMGGRRKRRHTKRRRHSKSKTKKFYSS